MSADSKHQLIFVDRLLATLVHLRHGITHDVLACWFGVDRSTITRAVGEVRPSGRAVRDVRSPQSDRGPDWRGRSPRSGRSRRPERGGHHRGRRCRGTHGHRGQHRRVAGVPGDHRRDRPGGRCAGRCARVHRVRDRRVRPSASSRPPRWRCWAEQRRLKPRPGERSRLNRGRP
ncbi:transposase family protein [Streptomyces olivaceus]|uniref:helix-turn-helix domain-containing protein n=1 Tax=Streptomyces olivaceus TaxID=47716 RepID=UPI00382AF2BA